MANRGTRVCIYGERGSKILTTSDFSSKTLQSQLKKWLLISTPLSRFFTGPLYFDNTYNNKIKQLSTLS